MSRYLSVRFAFATAALVAAALAWGPYAVTGQSQPEPQAARHQATLNQYCGACHNEQLRTAELSVEGLDFSRVAEQSEIWEKVIGKLRTRTMPPAGQPRPADETYDSVAAWLESKIDQFAAANPNPGPNRSVPSPQPLRIRQCRPRSVGARSRRGRALARGRHRPERFRQHGRRIDGVARIDGAVSVGGAQNRPAGGRRGPAGAGGAELLRADSPPAGQPDERRPSVWLTGRGRGPAFFSG